MQGAKAVAVKLSTGSASRPEGRRGPRRDHVGRGGLSGDAPGEAEVFVDRALEGSRHGQLGGEQM